MMPSLQSPKLRFINDLWAGCMSGIITLTVSVAMAALVFKGDLAVFLPAGMGMALIGAAVTGTVTNVCSTFKGTMAGPQSTSSIVIALGASAIFSALAAEGDAAVIGATLGGYFFASTLAVGLTLFLLGRLGVGRWVRWIPQPVMRGILAGTGWLIIGNALEILENITGGPALWRGEVSAVQLANIVTAFLVGAAAFYLDQRQSHGMHRPTWFTAMFCAAALFLWWVNSILIKQHLSGRHHRSTVERPDRDQRILTAQGHRIHIIRLQGYLFFGSVFKFYQFLTGLFDRMASPDSHYLLLDFENVQGVDSSALYILRKAVNAASRRTGVYWVLSPARPYLKALTPASARTAGRPQAMACFPDLDRVLEWCEDHLLATVARQEAAARPSPLPGQMRIASIS